MNKLFIAASVMATLVSSISVAQAADTGTITFNGDLIAATCNVAVGGGTTNAIVTLPSVNTSNLAAAAQTAGLTGFNMTLSGCGATPATASAYFESGTGVNAVNGNLLNTGAATNVELQLLDGSNNFTPIKAGDAGQINATQYVNVASGTATLPYAVQYYATGLTGAGSVTSTVTYALQYK